MEKHFMIDIETTGIDPVTEDLLQVGVLEVDFVNGLWKPGRSLEFEQYTSRTPKSSFAKEHMSALYARCRETPYIPPYSARILLLTFFENCGVSAPDIYCMGWNAAGFDLPFLFYNNFLKPSSYVQAPDGKDVRVGDVHYRVYEMAGALALAENVLRVTDRKELLKSAEAAGFSTVELPSGKEHDALYDCYKQVLILNGLIQLMKAKLI